MIDWRSYSELGGHPTPSWRAGETFWRSVGSGELEVFSSWQWGFGANENGRPDGRTAPKCGTFAACQPGGQDLSGSPSRSTVISLQYESVRVQPYWFHH